MISSSDVAMKCVKTLQESFESIGKVETIVDATAVINYAYGVVDFAAELMEEDRKRNGHVRNNGTNHSNSTVLPGNDDLSGENREA